jgi:hypothetical protein
VVGLTVVWPGSGTVQQFSDIAPGHYYTLREGGKTLTLTDKTPIHFNSSMPMMHMMHH